MEPTDRRVQWLRWLDQLRTETMQLLSSREVYVEVRNIVANNPKVRTDNRLIQWMTWNYGQSMLIAIRRLVDQRKDVISLVRLLRDMDEHCDRLTWEAHAELYSEGDREFLARRTFDNLAGEGATAYPKEYLQKDQAELLRLWNDLKMWANKRIAHLDEKQFAGELPRYEHLDKMLEELERQVKNYSLLLEARCFTSLLPTPQWDWKEIFQYPWLPKEGDRRNS